MGCICSSDKTAERFGVRVSVGDFRSAELILTNGYGNNSSDFVNVNAIVNGESVLATFLHYSRGTDVSILEKLLFPAKTQQRCCDIFVQKHTRDDFESLFDDFDYPLPFHQLFCMPPPQSLGSGPSVAPYFELLLEAADLIPSPKIRNDPSIWLRHASRWNNDKENLVIEIVEGAINYGPKDLDLFRLILDNNLIQKQENLTYFIFLLAAQEGTAPILREILSSGKFPDSLKNSNITASSLPERKNQLGTPLAVAVLHRNVEFIKELVANNVGGSVNDGIPNNKRILTADDVHISQLSRPHHLVNVLHLAAVAPADESPDGQKMLKMNFDESSDPFVEILTVLLAMPGSNEVKNAAAPFASKPQGSTMRLMMVANEFEDLDDDSSSTVSQKADLEVTPAMLAAIRKHDARLEILLANGGDQLPESLREKFGSFNDVWLADLRRRQAEEELQRNEKSRTKGGARGVMRMRLRAR